tara:strand:+ start:205 stop:585 length:381 start_codon:yes stop_codon:yes gene_type:complete
MLFLKGIPLYFRKLNYDDIKYSYYNLMSLLSDYNINLINTLTYGEFLNKFNYDHIVFVIINSNTNTVVASGTIEILNKKSRCNVCIIKEIIIDNEYEKEKKLYSYFLNNLINYSVGIEKCVKYIIK